MFSQTNKPSPDINVYRDALLASLDKMEKSWGAEFRDANVQSQFELTDDSATQLGEHRVEYLGYQDMIAKYKKLHKEFNILIVHPMKLEEGKLKIGISFHSYIYKKKVHGFQFGVRAQSLFILTAKKKDLLWMM